MPPLTLIEQQDPTRPGGWAPVRSSACLAGIGGRSPVPAAGGPRRARVLTRQQGVLNAQHRRSVPAGHGFHDLLFGDIGTAFFYSNTSFQVIKISSVEFKKFHEQHP